MTVATTYNGQNVNNGTSSSSSVLTTPLQTVQRYSSSAYPLVTIEPPKSVKRFPLLSYDSAEAKVFAQSTQDGRILADAKGQFDQNLPVAAINFDAPSTSKFQQHALLKKHILKLHKFRSLVYDESDARKRRILFNVESFEHLPIDVQQFLRAEQENGNCAITTANVHIGYDYWNTEDVLTALLPQGLPDGTPTTFTSTGHIAHINLREEYLPYRFVIGQVMLDKNGPVIETVVNKLDTIDTQFRFFAMERLAGKDAYTVTVSESGCKFTFDFRRVYWNSRLHTEHARLINEFSPYEVVSDVMAGVGPFAVPAAKKGCYVLANDLNPASFESLELNTEKNHVTSRLRASCVDGNDFIKQSVEQCWHKPFAGAPLSPEARASDLDTSSRQRAKEAHQRALAASHEIAGDQESIQIKRGPARRLIDHFVMNLPASAIDFLGSFRGAYASIAGAELEDELARREKEAGNPEAAWPLVHVHCFTKDLENPYTDICTRANKSLNINLDSTARLVPPPPNPGPGLIGGIKDDATVQQPDTKSLNPSKNVVNIHLVRSVAPNKDMYCLSFRLTRAMLLSVERL